MNNYFKCFFVLLILLQSESLLAQTIVIQNHETKEPIADIYVVNKTHSASQISDAKGKVKLDVFSHPDTLVFQHPSYKNIQLTKAEILEKGKIIFLIETAITLAEPIIIGSTIKDVFSEKNSAILIKKMDAKSIKQINPQTSADMLQASGEVLVQKSQSGGGSPMIRGFEASRVLLVVDGVRLNNAIYRSGHLQNAITIDNSILEKVEILFGPGSVAYGSDALGGVVHFYTKNPKLSYGDSSIFNTNAYLRYSSANQEKSTHLDFSVGFKKIGFLTSVTLNDFGDLRMGSKRKHGYNEFGEIPFYASVINGKDSMTVNPDTDIHINSGYKQMDLLQKIYFEANKNLNFTLNLQYSNSSDIPRYDRLTEFNGDILKFSEWKYGPQNRFLASFQTKLHNKSGPFFNEANITAAYQKIDEDRIKRKFGATDQISQYEDVHVYSLNIDFNKRISNKQHLFYGFEGTYNDVFSNAETKNIQSGSITPAATRYPDAGSSMYSIATYVGYKNKLSKSSTLTLGARYSQILLNAKYSAHNDFYALPFTELNLNNGALSGSAGIVIRPNKQWKINLALATGFKSPNLDDATKVREKGGFVTVPNNQLKPEYAYNGEFGVSRSFIDKTTTLQVALFYTYLDNAIVTRDFQLNNQSKLLYEGDSAIIQTNLNASKAQVYGVSSRLAIDFTKELSFNATLNYTIGKDLQDNLPIAHIAPLFGRTSLAYEIKKWQTQLFVDYNGWKRIADFAPGSTDNPALATLDGSPAWYTINVNTSYNLLQQLVIQLGIDNILDHHYKPFASGISGTGRNIRITLRATL